MLFSSNLATWAIAGILIVMLIGCNIRGSNSLRVENIVSIPGTASESQILLDSAVDEEAVHLVWKEEDTGISYQSLQHGTSSWSQANVFSNTASGRVTPHVYHLDQELILMGFERGLKVWASTGGEERWREVPSRTLKLVPPNHSVAQEKGNVYLVFERQGAIFFISSGDFGRSWSEPTQVAVISDSRSSAFPSLSIASRDDDLTVVWAEQYRRPNGTYRSRLQIVRSSDRGKTWSAADRIPLDRSQYGDSYDESYSFRHVKVVPARDSIWLFYIERGLFLQRSAFEKQGWTRSERIAEAPSGSFDVHEDDSSVVVAWSDERNREKDWWGYIPGHQILTWNIDPRWANNDLYFARFGASDREEQRLTPPLSFVSAEPESISINAAPDQIYVFWSGRRKVGETLDQYGFPTEVFYTKLSN